jgi:hypothetical protein
MLNQNEDALEEVLTSCTTYMFPFEKEKFPEPSP